MSIHVQNSSSPNFGHEEISVEFLILHYTACTLEETLRIFTSAETKVCAHFVIDAQGLIYDLGGFLNGPIRQGAHAGMSKLCLDGREWERFNQFSIGIELVNLNGNLFPYTSPQYDSLEQLARHLGSRFPNLKSPDRILGHEEIAGFRGKTDPGREFHWDQFLGRLFSPKKFQKKESVLTAKLMAQFEQAHGKIEIEKLKDEDWPRLSTKLEAFVAESFKRDQK